MTGPRTRDGWTTTEAKHLLNRAGFGGRADEIAEFVELGPHRSIDRLLDSEISQMDKPSWLSNYTRSSLSRIRRMSQEERRKFRRMNRRTVHDIQMDWIERMISTEFPPEMLRAKMTFFWHGHFATSVQKVNLPPLIFKQLQLFEEQAIGSFRDLLHGISRDPAMLRYLDNNQNRKGKPNENFARELMELFSLGPGNYSEQDVKEAARAFTGWTNDPLEFRVRPRWHDRGRKVFLGREGNFDGEDIVNIILDHPACAEFVTRKLLTYFGLSSPSEDFVKATADGFRHSDYDLRQLLRSIFSSPEFYSKGVIGNQIKSPLQLVVGTMRTLGAETRNNRFYLQVLEMMGQVPYMPPNVKGWPGGTQWIDTSRLLTRYTFAEIVSRGEIPAEMDPRSADDVDRPSERPNSRERERRAGGMGNPRIEFDPHSLVSPMDSPEVVVDNLAKHLLSQALNQQERETLISNYQASLNRTAEREALKLLIGDIMTSPVYQLY
ncbi:DUF1800 domain-containing protein [bacterium]|nr:DUF1800 domain-containing protein [bacterium]